MTITPYGPNALLLRFAKVADEAAFRRGRELVAELERHPPPGLREIVPAFTTLLLDLVPGTRREEVLTSLKGFDQGLLTSSASEDGRLVEIPVRYDGTDLARVSEQAGLPVEEVIARHTAPVYRVHCLGFAPGFPYLGGLDPRLHTPRRASPRPRVPAGSVAIGGEHTGIYSIPSPGGWNLIGATHETLFKPAAGSVEEIFLLRAGDRVRFIARDALSQVRETHAEPPPGSPANAVLRVLVPGLGMMLQDAGRPGFARFGVPPGGPMDPHAAGWANRLLDNPPGAPVLELCLQGQRLEVLRDGWLAVGGSSAPRGKPAQHAFRVSLGEVLEFLPGRAGVWTCLAVPGGFSGERILGSVGTNVRAGLGRSFAAGDKLEAGPTGFAPPAAISGRAVPWDELRDFAGPPPLRVWPGPQWDVFTAADREQFFGAEWTVSSQCDRVGYRLQGPALRPDPAPVISEPVLPGSIQVPANGQPIVTMPDGPTIGGYPKLGVVEPADLPWLAQGRPGQRMRFRLIE